MDYREALQEQVEKYYHEILAEHGKTTVAAMKDGKKLGLFKKRDFSGHIAKFEQHKADAQALDVRDIEIPTDDVYAQNLAEAFLRSVTTFIMLCEDNIRFYDITERKQYKDSGVTVKNYTDAFQRMQTMLSAAVRDLEALDEAYKEYNADNFSEE